MARGAVEDSVADGIEGLPGFVAQAHADGVRPAVRDQRVIDGDSVQNGRGVFGDFRGREAKPRGEHWVYGEVGGGAA